MDMRTIINLLTETEAGPSPAETVIAAYRESPEAGVDVEMVAQGDDTVALQWIKRLRGVRKGAGARALQRLCDLADAHEVWITLGVDVKDAKGLVPFYARFGFEEDEWANDGEYLSLNREPDVHQD